MRKVLGQWKPERMITRLMISEGSSKNAGHKGRYQADHSDSFLPRLVIGGSSE
jgi:hypothetical protein